MLLRPTVDDVRVIVRSTGLGVLALGTATCVVAGLALLAGDVDSASALLLGGAVGVAVGTWVRHRVWSRAPLTWTRATVSATLTWIAGSLLGGLPLYLSGHYRGYLDAVFEAMSGLTTTGCTATCSSCWAPSPSSWWVSRS
jgi:trk system potassium uptake protein TrkH